ncbi:MAG: response regulator transcription factor [Chloroflexi bacterium]|nr:response regulator transcription factor [Chloroflexota bacterium]
MTVVAVDRAATQCQRISVVVADDHPVVRSGIVYELSRQPDIEVLGAAANGDMALQLAQSLQPQVLVLDVSMPGLRTVDVVRQSRKLPSPPQILVLTAHGEIEHVLKLLNAGVTGYLLKDEDPETISVAVRQVAKGERSLSPTIAASMVEHSVAGPAAPAEAVLSPRELEVMRVLASAKSNYEIGLALDMSERTVRYYLRNIYDKLHLTGRTQALAWAIRHGLDQS